jgi:hypothetical protein
VVVLFGPFEDHGFENALGTPDSEMVHLLVFSHLKKIISMDLFLSIHLKSKTTVHFLRTKEVEQEQQTLMKEACLSVFVHQEEMFSHVFHDPVACYMECFNNQNLQLMMSCKLRNKDDGQSTSVLNMDCLPPGVSFQSTLSYDSKDYYFQQSQQIFQPLGGNQQVKSHENKNAVEGVKHDYCFVHVLEDPFAVLLEAVNSPNVFNFLRFEFIDKFLNELSVNRLWSKHVQRKQTVDKMLAWLHWHYDFI